MNRGDVAVSHLIAIALGLIVLGVIIYFLYQNITETPIHCQKCAAELASWCARCYMTDYGNKGPGPDMNDDLKACIGECGFGSTHTCGTARDFCKSYVPL